MSIDWKSPPRTIIRIPVDAPRKQQLRVEFHVSRGIEGIENDREIFAYLFKAKLIPRSE